MTNNIKRGAYAFLLFPVFYIMGCSSRITDLEERKARFMEGSLPSVTAEEEFYTNIKHYDNAQLQMQLNNLVCDIRRLQDNNGKTESFFSIFNLEDIANWESVGKKTEKAIALTNLLRERGLKAGQINRINIDALLENLEAGDRLFIGGCIDALIINSEFWTQYSGKSKPDDWNNAPKTPRGSYGRVDYLYKNGSKGKTYLRGKDTKIKQFCRKYR